MSDHPLTGVWRLVSFELHDSAGEVSYPYGRSPSGYIFYGADGYMSVAIMHGNRPPFGSLDPLSGSLEEKAQAMITYLTYCGRYEIQGDVVVHHMEVSLFPDWTGRDQRRFFRFEGSRLMLRSAPLLFGGKEQTVFIVWERV